MVNNSKKYNRKSIRLKGYDYSQAGLYFVTICCQNREHFFGEIDNNGQLLLNDAGKMIEKWYLELENKYPNIECGEYVVMPNHFHCIIQIVGATLVVATNKNKNTNNENMDVHNVNNENTDVHNVNNENTDFHVVNTNIQKGQPQGFAPTVGNIIGVFKSITTVEYINGVKNNHWKPFIGKLWQRNYWEHIIRNEQSYVTISEYIKNNPVNWNADKLK